MFAASALWPSLLAQTATPSTPSPTKLDEEVYQLSPFEVKAEEETGYTATDTLAGTRIRTDLKDVGAAISVITKEFMKDIGATDNGTLLQYTTNAEVAGTRGTYAGLGNGATLDESANLRSPQGAQRIRGLSSADNTRDFFITDIPWDGYNVDRIDILRGPNSFLFGLGSPAGIVNASLRNAEFRNRGQVEARYGSYNSVRTSVDLNEELIHGVLAVRVSGLLDDQKYQQEGAFQNQRRGYFAVRYDPQLFKDRSAHTSIKIKAENGKIDADRPRSLPVYDNLTPWWSSMNKLSLATPYVAGSNPRGVNNWITQYPGNVQQPVWILDGETSQLYQIYAGVVNTGALNANGVPQNAASGVIGMNYAFEQFGLNNASQYASNAGLPNAGNYKNKSLTDTSVFDYYNILIDGPTKSEWERWNAFNVDLSQTFLNDRIGINLSFDHQKYRNGSQSLLGGSPTLTIDILQSQADLSTNANYGRPYVMAGPGSGGTYQSDRKFYRASLFGELRPNDFLHSDILLKLIGRQRLNGVASQEKFFNQRRSWQMYANSQAWAGYYGQSTGNTSSIADRAPNAIIYLGSTLKNAATVQNAHIPGITAPIFLKSGNVYNFASTWKNNPGVTYSDAWTVPANLQPMFNATGGPNSGSTLGNWQGYTQVSNPANYVGWNSNFYMNLLSYDNGADQSLLTSATQSLRETDSFAGSYQGYFLGDALIATLGWRYDQVKTKDVTAKKISTNRSILDLSAQTFALPAEFPPSQIKKGHSTSKSLVFHINKVMDNYLKRDPLPLNVGLTFNDSSNFQVTSIRRDMYGNALGDPTGQTREYGAWVSTKDGKFSLRAVKYTTTLTANDSGLSGIGGQIGGLVQQGLKWRNVFLYQLGLYDLASADGGSYRNTWTNAFPNETNPAAKTDAAITTWNNIQKWLDAKGFFKVWGFTPQAAQYLVDRTTYLSNPSANTPPAGSVYAYAASAPQGFTVTADTVSRGYEFEFTYNPLPNWRIAFNASESTAVRTNFGGPGIDEFMDYMKSQLLNADGTPAPGAMLPNFGGPNGIYNNNWVGLYSTYTLLKAQQGANVPEIRKWRYNVITNYTFTGGRLKGVGVGGAYRWQDKVGIGYPIKSNGSFDIENPYYGPSEDGIDLWVSYEHRISKKINWRCQLNVRNAFANEGLIPITIQPDNTWAAVRMKPTQEWFVTNTFSF
ncbi:MAG TPA: TonB-dependent receptor plug domain-containing protein [Lacunisphaera sp.]